MQELQHAEQEAHGSVEAVEFGKARWPHGFGFKNSTVNDVKREDVQPGVAPNEKEVRIQKIGDIFESRIYKRLDEVSNHITQVMDKQDQTPNGNVVGHVGGSNACNCAQVVQDHL